MTTQLIKTIFFQVGVLLSYSLFAVTPPPQIDTLRPLLISEDLLLFDRTLLPTGILQDVGETPVDFGAYNGVMSDYNYINHNTFCDIIEGIRSSTLRGSRPMAVSTMKESMRQMLLSGVNPIGIAVYRYNYYKENVVSMGLITLGLDGSIDDSFEQGGGAWLNPYEESYVIAFSPYSNFVNNTVTYSFPPTFRFSNDSVSSIEFDAGDGVGYRQIGLNGETVSISYLGSSTKELKLKITLADQTVLFAHSQVALANEEASNTAVNSDQTLYFQASQSYYGYVPNAKVDIVYAEGESPKLLNHPLIVAEGFDPLSDPYIFLINPNGTGDGFTHAGNFYNSNTSSAVKSKYDLIYVNWLESTAPIEANADILRQVILYVKNNMIGDDKIVLLGQSMGGLIARYALCQMEQAGITHRVKAFISHDVPYLGVNVPLGYQYLAQHLYDVYDNAEWLFFEQDILHWLRYVNLLTLTQFQTYKNEILAIREAPSVRQMLSVYVNKYKQLDYSQFNGFISSLSQMSFPQGDPGCEIINLCISNGGVNDYVTPSTNRLLDIDVFADSGGLLTALIPVWGLWDYEHFGVLGLVPTTSSFRTIIRISPNKGDGSEIAYASSQYQKQTGFFSGVTRQNQNLTFSYYSPIGIAPKDTDYGSYYDMYKDTTNVQVNWNFAAHWKVNFALERKFMFVPTVSSLCYKCGVSLSSSDYVRNFYQSGVEMEDIPFDGYFIGHQSNYHTVFYNTNPELVWADRMMDLDFAYIPSQVDSLDGFQFHIADADSTKGSFTVDWSTSDSSIATINSYGTLTFVNWGTVSIYADISFNGGHRRLTHTITIPPAQFPGFPSYYLSYIDPPMDLNGNIVGGYYVSAHRTTSIDSRFLSHFTYHWGVKYNNGDSIQWSTSTSTGYNCNMPDLASARMVYFKVQYENQFSQTYSIYLRYPLIIGLIDGAGNVYSGNSGGWVGQVKGEISEGKYVFSCLGFEDLFEQYPAPDETIRRMLLHPEFIDQLKVLKPWGKEELVLIPYMYRREDEEKWEEKVMTFIYKEIIQ